MRTEASPTLELFSQLVREPSKSKPSLGRRAEQVIERFLEELGRLLNISLGMDLCLRQVTRSKAVAKDVLTRPCVEIELQVYQSTISIFLTAECVADLVAVTCGQRCWPISNQPSDKELTVISYLVARALCEVELLSKHHLHLSAVVVHNSASELEGRERKVSCALQSANSQELGIELEMSNTVFPVLVMFPKSFLDRIQQYSRLIYDNDMLRALFSNYKHQYSARMQIRLRSISELFELKHGKLIYLNSQNAPILKLQTLSGEEVSIVVKL